MNWLIIEETQAILNFCIAALFLVAKPRRIPNLIASSLFFSNGIYAAFSGVHYGILLDTGLDGGVVGDLAEFIPTFSSVVTWAGMIVFPFFFPQRRLSSRGETWLLGGAGLFVLAHLIALFVAKATQPNGFNALPNNPGHWPLAFTSFTPFYVGLVVGVVLLLDTFLSSPSPIQRDQARLILLAYLLKIISVLVVIFYFGIVLDGSILAPRELPTPNWLIWTWVALLGGALALVPIALLSSRIRGSARQSARRWPEDAFIVVALLLGMPLCIVSLEAEYNLVRPVLFAYGILMYQTLDVDLREHRTLVATTLVAGVAGVFMVAARDIRNLGADPSVATGAGFALTVGLAALLALPILRLALAREGATASEPRGRELYRAALEESVAATKGHSTSEDAVLRSLRARLGISEREHQLLESSVRASFGKPADGLAVGRRFLDRYQIEKLLGEGGFARTFLARDEQTGRAVVVKAARFETPEEGKRVLREARHLARTQHPNVVTIYDIESVADSCFLVLEYVEGGSLAQRLERGPLPWPEAARLADDVLAALDAAHAEGLIHRDIKPANILLAKDGRAKLADFGVARADPRSDTLSGFSVTGTQPGSVEYMSPEQVRGRPLDARSDLYSVGVVLYETLAGRSYLRFQGRAGFDARLAILEESPALPLDGVPDELNALLADAVAKDVARRPENAAAMRRRIRAILARSPDADTLR